MTAPDPGLTDLIAAHTFESGGGGDGYHEPFSFGAYCSCGEEYGSWVQVAGDDGLDYPDIDLLANLHAAHVALVVEQHTNGRIAEKDRLLVGWRDHANAQQERAETAEATVARVEELVERGERHGSEIWAGNLRAALEGEQQ